MPRGARLAFENSFLHVFNRGINKSPIFLHSNDYDFFLNRVLDLGKKYDHSIYALCLLPNHFHLSVQTRKDPISKIMSSLATSYSMYFNRAHQHFGPVFQNRFKSILIQTDDYFLGLSRYIYLNPVRAGLTKDPLIYQYSTLAEATGDKPLKFLDKDIVRLIGDTKGSQESYRQFVYEGVAKNFDDFENLFQVEEAMLGSNLFATFARKKYLRGKVA